MCDFFLFIYTQDKGRILKIGSTVIVELTY